MKKISFLLLCCFLMGSFTEVEALSSTTETPSPINETTLSLYCRNMFYAADLSNQTTLFWGHQGIDHFPSFLENKNVSSIIGLSQLQNCSNNKKTAFAAILNDGTLFCWGDKKYGGLLPRELVGKRVLSVISNRVAFAALLEDGSVKAWGSPAHGGTTPPILLNKPLPGHRVISLTSTQQAFTALLEDGTICSWGDPYHGGNAPKLTDVTSVLANQFAFTAILKNGSVVSWCNLTAHDYDTPNLTGDTVKKVVATRQMFSALLESGKIISWGFKSNQIVTPSLKSGENGISIAAHDDEFTACLDSGRILLWNGYDRDSTSLQGLTEIGTNPAPSIVVSDTSFALLPKTGVAFSWKSVMDNEGTYGVADFLSPANEVIDMSAIPDGFCMLSKGNRISSLTWTTQDGPSIKNVDITPTLPTKDSFISLYAHWEHYETKPFPIVAPAARLALLENPMSNVGQWEYHTEQGWLRIPTLPDSERTERLILPADTKIRFVPTVNFDGSNIPGLMIQRL